MLQAHGLTMQLGTRCLFRNLSLQLARGSRIGLVGTNGAGKTTLLRIVAGELPADAGQVSTPAGSSIGYLPQETPRSDHGTVLERVMQAASEVQALLQEVAQVEKQLTHSQAAEAMTLAQRHAELSARLTLLDGYSLEARARRLLCGLGFTQAQHHGALAKLSGGWWMRVELARLLLLRPDYLLLDEPTNHLDLNSLAWLESFLSDYPGAVLVVSHDRYFLDRLVQSIAELSSEGLLLFPGNYAAYLEAQIAIQATLQQQAQDRAKRFATAQAFIERFAAKASKARQVQSRRKQMAKEGLTTPPETHVTQRPKMLRMVLPSLPRAGDIVLSCAQLSKRFGNKVIYNNLNLSLQRGSKVALLGDNGTGKSTLLKLLAQRLAPDSGSVQWGHQVQPYYFAQHQLDTLDAQKTVYETLVASMPQAPIKQIRAILGAFLFDQDGVQKRVGILSGGEKSRLALACMLAAPYNLLLLDEPTNHLDLPSRNVLEDALADYQGTCIFISHDRYFIQRLASSVLYLESGGHLQQFDGDYDYFLFKMAALQASRAAASAPNSAPHQAANPPPAVRPPRHERTAQRKIAQLEKRITQLEALLRGYTEQLCDPQVYQNHQQFAQIEAQRQQTASSLADCMQAWESASQSVG